MKINKKIMLVMTTMLLIGSISVSARLDVYSNQLMHSGESDVVISTSENISLEPGSGNAVNITQKLKVNEDATFDKNITVDDIATVETQVRINDRDSQIILDANAAQDIYTIIQDGNPSQTTATITLPSQTTTLPGLSLTNTYSGTNIFTNTWTDFSYALRHYGDTDTYIQFGTDRIDLRAGNVIIASVIEGLGDSFVVNDYGYSYVDFRVETDNINDAIEVDASADEVQLNAPITSNDNEIILKASTSIIPDQHITCDLGDTGHFFNYVNSKEYRTKDAGNTSRLGLTGWFDDGSNFNITVTNGLITGIAGTSGTGGYYNADT